jgi:arsenate reductase-like glutaredoxin family protein
MIKLKEFLKASDAIKEDVIPARKRDVKSMEMKANKIVKMMKELAKDFKKVHGTKENQLWNQFKDFEELARKASTEYGGWFGFVYDSDYVGDK